MPFLCAQWKTIWFANRWDCKTFAWTSAANKYTISTSSHEQVLFFIARFLNALGRSYHILKTKLVTGGGVGIQVNWQPLPISLNFWIELVGACNTIPLGINADRGVGSERPLIIKKKLGILDLYMYR